MSPWLTESLHSPVLVSRSTTVVEPNVPFCFKYN